MSNTFSKTIQFSFYLALHIACFSSVSLCNEIITQNPEECPRGSICNKKTAQLYRGWINQLKNLKEDGPNQHIEIFKDKYGIPFKVWKKKSKQQDKDLSIISWHSICRHHLDKEGKTDLFRAEIFIKNLSTPLPKNIFIEKAYLLLGDGKVTTYFIPRNERPMLIKNDKLTFIDEVDGIYYSVQIAPDGNFTVVPAIIDDHSLTKAKCPPKLVELFKQKPQMKNIYSRYSCNNIWVSNLKEYRPILFGHSCH
ncbi:MAG: hypothetical protein ISR65_02800 [Bacteriovoracaceae bacterium]|nr:hypothetical protein [Bacteriovoracaceae bacterium]